MSLKRIWLWFYLFIQTYFFWRKDRWSLFLPMRSTEAGASVAMGAGTWDSSDSQLKEGQCNLFEAWMQGGSVPNWWPCVMYSALCPFPKGCEPLPGPSWNAYLFSSDHKASSTGRWRPHVKKNGRNRDCLQQLWRIMASLSTFPFLVQWQRHNSYLQLVSGLPFPMSSKCLILPRGLSSLEEGDVSQKVLYLDWGFLATPVHSFHYLSNIHCLWRIG